MPLIHALPVATTVPGTPRPSASVAVSGTSTTSVGVQPLCPTWATENHAVVVLIEAQQSFDSEVTWEDYAQLQISPPQTNRAGQIPSMTCQETDNRGQRRARVLLTVTGGSIPVGVDITV